MTQAEYDLANAIEMSLDIPRHTKDRAFHSQQAAEKAIKAAIASSGVAPRWIHNLPTLAGDLPSGWLKDVSESDLETLSEYALTGRYGGTEITKSEADRALDIATVILNAMRSRL